MQQDAAALAMQFNRQQPNPRPDWNVSYLPTTLYCVKVACDDMYPSGEAWILVEPELEGKYTKWNDNGGGVRAPLPAAGGIGSMALFRGSTTCPSSTVGRAASSYPPVAVTSGSSYSLLEGSAAGSESLSDLAEVEPTGRSLSGSMCSLASLATIKPLMVQAAMDSNTSLASPCLSRRPNDRRLVGIHSRCEKCMVWHCFW